MTPRLAGAALAVLGLILGLGLGYCVGREGLGSRSNPVASTSPPAATPSNAALVASLRKELAELHAREARHKLDGLGGGPRPRTPPPAPGAGVPGVPGGAPANPPTRPASRDAFLAALRGAVASKDAPALAYLSALLQQSLADGSLGALDVVGWLRTEPDAQVLETLVEALPGALGGELPRDALTVLLGILEGGAAEANRAAALHVLNGTNLAAPEALPRLLALAEHEGSPDLRAEVLGSLARYLTDENPGQRDSVAAALLRAARQEENPRLRAEAVSALQWSPTLPVPDGLALLEVLRGDRDEDVRSTVVGLLPYLNSLTPEARLSAMEEQYARDDSPRVRRTLLTSLVALGAARSRGALERIRGVDPALQQDVDDYLTILRSGATDAAEIETRKSALHDEKTLDGSDR